MYDAILTTYFPEAAVQMDFQSNVTLILENVVNVLHSHLLEGVLKQQVQSFFRIALTSVFCFDENAHVVVLIAALVDRLHPSAVIAVDALASRSLERLGTTVQIGNTGISPGSGIGGRHITLNAESLGVPVIAVGVPTVVDAATLACDILGTNDAAAESRINSVIQGRDIFVTPKETDLLTERAARILAMSINCALQPGTDPDILSALIS